MKLELDDMKVLTILEALRSEYVTVKDYYEEFQDEEQRIGVTSPEEIEQTYNDILAQAQEQGELTSLDKIKG